MESGIHGTRVRSGTHLRGAENFLDRRRPPIDHALRNNLVRTLVFTSRSTDPRLTQLTQPIELT
jgi:hypothetical protein